MVLGYWSTQGRAQVIRYLLEFLRIDYLDFKYQERDQWFKEHKKDLADDTLFPNLPYLIDTERDLVMTETPAILDYILYKSGRYDELMGRNMHDQALSKQVLGVIGDVFEEIFKLVFIYLLR